jgi:hypothetical protein
LVTKNIFFLAPKIAKKWLSSAVKISKNEKSGIKKKPWLGGNWIFVIFFSGRQLHTCFTTLYPVLFFF